MLLARIAFVIALMFVSAVVGGMMLFLLPIGDWVSSRLVSPTKEVAKAIAYETGLALPFYYSHRGDLERVRGGQAAPSMPGATLLTQVGADDMLEVVIIAQSGDVIQRWPVDWFELWPNPDHLPADKKPQQHPGTHIHGAVLLDDGSVVFNFENLGLIRLDACGKVVWRLPERTHHAIYQAEDGTLWLPSERDQPAEPGSDPLAKTRDYTILQLTQDATVLREISVNELLKQNDLLGYIFTRAQGNEDLGLSGDALHLNDVDIFPTTLPATFFAPGDIMISLRNINTIFVFDGASLKLKKAWTGPFLRQHDPDFIDGDTISVFDNNNVAAKGADRSSKILLLHANDDAVDVVYEGTPAAPFYTAIMGKHQTLANGNVLITESMNGRVFEIDPSGAIVWEYNNIVGEGMVGLVEEGQRLPERFDGAFFAAARSACPAPAQQSGLTATPGGKLL